MSEPDTPNDPDTPKSPCTPEEICCKYCQRNLQNLNYVNKERHVTSCKEKQERMERKRKAPAPQASTTGTIHQFFKKRVGFFLETHIIYIQNKI